ncbi:response regulator transcription factor [Halorubrum sp. SS7]|nr:MULTISPECIES: response regulator [unclassified Halorubrum]TKX52677.1 response regulator transcription factor [Halorubrum sp. SP3]TKX56670.1 response regulator transcription factor [Halorubrum sp. SS7]
MTAEKIILLVEDNDDLASLYQHYLMNAYQVRLAQTGKEAIRKATPAVDLIILDYKLPDMLGTDVYDQLRANGSTTPVVLISGSDPESLPDRVDPVTWLTKPFYKEKLHNTVQKELSPTEESV